MQGYYTAILPKILYLALLVIKYKKNEYYNTNDLTIAANEIASDLVRQRKDKKDYRFLEDTRLGGLRGNFSTVLTFRGYIKKGSRYTAYYGIGSDDRLVNATLKGDIIFDRQSLSAHTLNKDLHNLLIQESRLLNIRENQAHIGAYLENNPELHLKRDKLNFPKESVVYSRNRVYFLRILFNNFTSASNNIIEYSLINYWQGSKFRRYNIHAMFVVPEDNNPWGEILAIDNGELFNYKPLFIYFDIKNKKCFDNKGNSYSFAPIDIAMSSFSTEYLNIDNRLAYDWNNLRDDFCAYEIEGSKTINDEEFSIFLTKFLKWEQQFSIDGKDVVGIKVSGSGGPDVILTYSGGTIQNLELEHKWINYINHGHHKNIAWSGSWLFADEDWDFELIKKLFYPLYQIYGNRVPNVYLCVDKISGDKRCFKVNWSSLTCENCELTN